MAAESHVDRSIDNPQDFIYTNVVGTFVLLDCVRKYLIDSAKKIKFLHISTDEVFELWKKKAFLLNKHHMIQDLHIQPPKLLQIIYVERGIILIIFQS